MAHSTPSLSFIRPSYYGYFLSSITIIVNKNRPTVARSRVISALADLLSGTVLHLLGHLFGGQVFLYQHLMPIREKPDRPTSNAGSPRFRPARRFATRPNKANPSFLGVPTIAVGGNRMPSFVIGASGEGSSSRIPAEQHFRLPSSK